MTRSWAEGRLRLCYWVMWKRPRTRIGKLLKLTDDPRTAIGLGRSSVGPWKASRMLGLILTHEWLMEQGATHLAQKWERCAAPSLNRPVRTRTRGDAGAGSWPESVSSRPPDSGRVSFTIRYFCGLLSAPILKSTLKRLLILPTSTTVTLVCPLSQVRHYD